MQSNGDRTHDKTPTSRRVTVPEAARILGISPEAIRARLSRGTLQKYKGPDGAVYVLLDTDNTADHTQPNGDRTNDHTQSNGDRTTDQSELVETLHDQVAYLRKQLDQEREAGRRKDHLLAAALERIPAIEPPETPQGSETPSGEPERASHQDRPAEAQEATERRSWWRRWFGSD